MSGTLKPILDAEGKPNASGWVNVANACEMPFGIKRPNGEVVTLIGVYDDVAFERMLASFREDKQRPNFAGILIDRDHLSRSAANPTEAMGWGMELEMREDGLYARSQWSDVGLGAVMGMRYKFTSLVHEPGSYEVISGNRVRPVRIDSIALTNDPRNTRLSPIDSEAWASLLNRAGHVAAAVTSAEKAQGEQSMDAKKLLLKLLGLAETATDQEIQTAADAKIQADAACKDQMTAMTARNGELTEALVARDLEVYAPVIEKPDDIKAALKADRAITLKVLAGLKAGGAALLARRDTSTPDNQDKQPGVTGLARVKAAFTKKQGG